MKVIKKILSGQPGSKKLQEKYGKQLLNIRYYEDRKTKTRIKTCELIIEKRHWTDKPPRVSPRKIVNLKIEFVDAADPEVSK